MFAPSMTVIDPLLSSPQKVTRHNDNMAAIQEPPNLELTLLAFASLESTDGNIIAKSEFFAAESENHVVVRRQQELGSYSESDDEDQDPFEQMMNRGNFLRQLRLLALADEQERLAKLESSQPTSSSSSSNDDCLQEEKKECIDESNMVVVTRQLEDEVTIHPITEEKILNYNSYLAHQRYYDDLKHVDIRYMDYGTIINPNYKLASDSIAVKRGNDNGGQNCGNLIIEQRKSLGKGGFCWDAAFCLGEFVIQKESEWNPDYYNYYSNLDDATASTAKKTNVLELGAGTGLCGLMIAKATNSHVLLTDLPELLNLMESNVVRNYCHPRDSPLFKNEKVEELRDDLITTSSENAKGTASAHVLRWGTPDDYTIAPSNDVIIGADIVASLYDPIALAQTLYDLSGPTTKIYISSKSRLDRPHELFWEEMERLFHRVEKVFNIFSDDNGKGKSWSRLRNTSVFFIVAEGKKQKA
mmetsp:Transcript_16337/g.32669  ORF Transcript_16337/g.32669 Transcript_16337/m.32669 type:complete len:471 (-) Transcript_16337:136-1548(-)